MTRRKRKEGGEKKKKKPKRAVYRYLLGTVTGVRVRKKIRVNPEKICTTVFALQIAPTHSRERHNIKIPVQYGYFCFFPLLLCLDGQKPCMHRKSIKLVQYEA